MSGTADYVVNQRLLLGFRGGDFRRDAHDFNVPDDVKFTFASTNVGMAGVPANLQHGSNFTNVLSNNAITKDLQERRYAQADATLYVHGGGTHQIKGGVQCRDHAARIAAAATGEAPEAWLPGHTDPLLIGLSGFGRGDGGRAVLQLGSSPAGRRAARRR